MTLIYKGTIIALGTPLEMKTKFMKNDVLEIHVEPAEEWAGRIAAVKGIKEVALFGTALHAVAEDSKTAVPSIEKLFKEAKAKGASVRKIQPSLEDVFVSSIEEYDKDHGAKKS